MPYEDPSFCSRLLFGGETGPDVRELKIRLNALGYSQSDAASASGTTFDANTEQDVRDFQTVHGLAVDGRAGTQTRSALNAAYTTWGTEVLSASTAPSHPHAVRELQRRLRQWGYYSGTPDGVWSRALDEAVRDYQDYHGLVADGVVGYRTYARLLEITRPMRSTFPVPMHFLELVCKWGRTYGLSPVHICGHIDLESNFNRCATSGVAFGLLQLSCTTARAMGYTGNCPGTQGTCSDASGGTGLYNADINLRYALRYLNQWVDAQWPCIQNAIAAYMLGRVGQDDAYVTEVLRGTYYWGRYSPSERH